MTPTEIARSLSAAQRRALPYLDHTTSRTPHDLKRLGQKGGFTVLEALGRKGLVIMAVPGLGGIFSPHTTYRFRLSDLGLAVRKILEKQEG